MSNRVLGGTGSSFKHTEKDVSRVVNSVIRDDAQPERWNPVCGVPVLGSSPPTLSTFVGTTAAYSFVSNSINQIYSFIALPATYKQGTPVVPVVEWVNATGGAGSVLWQLEYIWQNAGNAFSQSSSTVSALVSATATANHLMQAQFASITASASIGAIFACRLARVGGDASDNFGGNVYLLNFKLLIQHDTNRGSQYQNQKFDR